MKNFLTQDVLEVALAYMEGLDCPRSLGVCILLRHRELDQLTSLEADPSHYSCSDDYLRAVAATDFFRKYRDFDLGIDLEAAAFEKWLWAERECFKTNRRLDRFLGWGRTPNPDEGPLLAFIERVRKNVIQLIGYRPPSTWEGAFGPGATVSDPSHRTTVCDKMSSQLTLTTGAAFHLIPWVGTKWGAAVAASDTPVDSKVRFVRGNVYFTVPKTARSLRSCGKEPSLNVFYQLGLGRVIRARLKTQGIDLENGQATHRQVACAASITGEFATIDLTSASDCVSTALVELLMPPPWYEALTSLRSPFTEVNGRWYRLEKFSSMGNGYTFELETTIFTAICMAVMGDEALPGWNLYVYGDDIIVPTVFARDVVWALKYFGFSPNPRKTFIEGSFRESCGGDYYRGTPVRAYYLKESPDEPQDIISLANGIRRMALQNSRDPVLWRNLRRSWFKCLDLLPSRIRRCRGPEALGDIVIHDAEDKWDTRWRSSIRYVRVYRPAKFRRVAFGRFEPGVQLAAALYQMSFPSLSERAWGRQWNYGDPHYIVPRDGVLGHKVGWAPFS